MNILFVCIIKVVNNKENTVYTLQYRNGVERSKQSGAVGTKRWNILLAYILPRQVPFMLKSNNRWIYMYSESNGEEKTARVKKLAERRNKNERMYS